MAHGTPKDYVCENCNDIVTTPVHCGKPMNLEHEISNTFWSCWKGEHEPCCGSEAILPYVPCCDNPKLRIGPDLKGANILL